MSSPSRYSRQGTHSDSHSPYRHSHSQTQHPPTLSVCLDPMAGCLQAYMAYYSRDGMPRWCSPLARPRPPGMTRPPPPSRRTNRTPAAHSGREAAAAGPPASGRSHRRPRPSSQTSPSARGAARMLPLPSLSHPRRHPAPSARERSSSHLMRMWLSRSLAVGSAARTVVARKSQGETTPAASWPKQHSDARRGAWST